MSHTRPVTVGMSQGCQVLAESFKWLNPIFQPIDKLILSKSLQDYWLSISNHFYLNKSLCNFERVIEDYLNRVGDVPE